MKVGLIGCGSIGSCVAKTLDDGGVPGMILASIYDIDEDKAVGLSKTLARKPHTTSSVREMIDLGTELIVEAASQEAVREHAREILRAGVSLVVMSVGAFTDDALIKDVEEAVCGGARLYLPSGAVCGLDGVKSAAVVGIDEVELTTTKPADTLKDVGYVKEKRVNLDGITESVVVFEGSAREAAKSFPKSINVSVALSLAGAGLDKTRVRIVADPNTKTNKHEIKVSSKAGKITTQTVNTPTPSNPRTSYLAAFSAIATLKNIAGNIRVGN